MTRRAVFVLAAVVVLAACQGTDDPGGSEGATVAQGARPAAAEGAAATAPDGVTVIGHGRVSGEPDTLRATVGVHVVRPDVDEAFDDAAAAADRVLAALDEHGVAEEDIQTREFSVRPEREPRPDQPPAVTGYAVRNLVEATIRDIDQAGELLAAVADAAGDDARVEGLSFSLEDDDAQLRAARENAVDDARRKAQHYAELSGATLGDVLAVTELSSELPRPVPLRGGAGARRGAGHAWGAGGRRAGPDDMGAAGVGRWPHVPAV